MGWLLMRPVAMSADDAEETGAVVTKRKDAGKIHRERDSGVHGDAPPRIPDAEQRQSQQREPMNEFATPCLSEKAFEEFRRSGLQVRLRKATAKHPRGVGQLVFPTLDANCAFVKATVAFPVLGSCEKVMRVKSFCRELREAPRQSELNDQPRDDVQGDNPRDGEFNQH